MALCIWRTGAMAAGGSEAILLVDLARTLSTFGRRTRDVSVPSDSFAMHGELRATIDSLEKVRRRVGALAQQGC